MFCAVVLAGERPGGSKFSRQLGLPASVLVDVAGKSALQWVIEALDRAQQVSGGLVCGPAAEIFEGNPQFNRILDQTPFHWLAPAAGPSASAIRAVQSLDHYPLLLTAGDHALLTADLVDGFCNRALAAGGDVVVGLVPYSIVNAAYPGSKRTVQKYRDGAFCGSNLYALLNPAGLAALIFWQAVEARRKHPWKIARTFGFRFLLRYLLRRISLGEAFQQLSSISGCQVSYVMIDTPRAAVDVDSVADRDLAEEILRADREA